MSKILIGLLLLLSFNSKAQNTYDSLKNFSYLLTAIKDDSPTNIATGFFLKHSDKLYLVSCYHVFTFRDVVNGGFVLSDVDTLSLRVFRKDNNVAEFLDIDIREIKKRSRDQKWYEKPDVFAYDVSNLNLDKDYKINSINRFVNNHIKLDSITKFVFYPYNYIDFKTFDDFKTKGTDYIHGNIFSVGSHLTDINMVDTFNYVGNIIDRTIEGGSGTPMFLLYKGKLTFGGLYSKADLTQKKAYFVKSEEVIKILGAK